MSVIHALRRGILPILALTLFLIMAGAREAPVTASEGEPTTAAEVGGSPFFSPETIGKILTQGGASAVLIVVLWAYRRDFFRRNESSLEQKQREIEDRNREIAERKAEEAHLARVLDQATTALTNSAVATSRQTDATHRLARTVEGLERRTIARSGELT